MLRSCETRSGKRQSALRVWSSLIALVIASSTVLADSVGVKAGPRVRAAMGGMDCPRTSRKSRGSECRRPPGFAFLSVAPTTPPLAVDDRNGKVWIFLGLRGSVLRDLFQGGPDPLSPPGQPGSGDPDLHGRRPEPHLPTRSSRRSPLPASRAAATPGCIAGSPITRAGLAVFMVQDPGASHSRIRAPLRSRRSLLSGRLRAAVLFANIGLKGKAAIRTLEPSCATISKGLPRTAEGFPRAGPRGGS